MESVKRVKGEKDEKGEFIVWAQKKTHVGKWIHITAWDGKGELFQGNASGRGGGQGGSMSPRCV